MATHEFTLYLQARWARHMAGALLEHPGWTSSLPSPVHPSHIQVYNVAYPLMKPCGRVRPSSLAPRREGNRKRIFQDSRHLYQHLLPPKHFHLLPLSWGKVTSQDQTT